MGVEAVFCRGGTFPRQRKVGGKVPQMGFNFSIEMHIKSIGISDRGRVRARNEDSFFNDDDVRLYIVADGMGGHVGGDVASKMAVEVIRDFIINSHLVKVDNGKGYDSRLNAEVGKILVSALRTANSKIYEESARRTEYRGMGTTTTTALVRNKQLTVAHVGDSRAYLVRDGMIRQVTEDHSWVNEQVKAGFITTEEARNHRFKNVITRSLGHEKDIQVDIVQLDLKEGDKFLLCSDGLSNLVSDAEIRKTVETLDMEKALEELVKLANERGGFDNITAVLIKVVDN